MTRKIKVKTLEEKAKDNLIKSAPANQEKTPVDYVIPDENETSVEPETTQAGKTLTPTVMDDMEYVKKLLADGVPIDYVDTTIPYEPNLPEPDLFINEVNQEARKAVSSHNDTVDKLVKSKKIVKEIMNKKLSETPDNSNQTTTKDSFEQIISKAKNMDDRICKVYNQDAPDSNEKNNNSYENVNHPNHYNNYDVEVIDMMERIWGPEKTAIFCELNAFKYRMRMGTKPTSPISEDLEKEIWYLNKMKALKNKILKSKL